MEEERLVKNVKKFVNDFENSWTEKSPKRSGRLKITSSDKVAALRESLEKNLQQGYVPQRSSKSQGRSLAEVKSELCKSMDALQRPGPPLSKNKSIDIYNLQEKFERTSKLSRCNTAETLNKCADDCGRMDFPVPMPRLHKLDRMNEIPRRYKSNSDLLSCDRSFSSGSQQPCTSGSQDGLEDILESSCLSSKLGMSESQFNSTSENIEDTSVFECHSNSSLMEASDKGDTLSLSRHGGGENVSATECKSGKCLTPPKDDDVTNSDDSFTFCCRLSLSRWNRIVTKSHIGVEEPFLTNAIKEELKSSKNPVMLTCNFDSIVDVLTFRDSRPLADVSSTEVKSINSQNVKRTEIINVAKRLESSLTALLNDIDNRLSCSANKEMELIDTLVEESKLKTKLKSLLNEVGMAINLLFLLNRMLQFPRPSPMKENLLQKLNDAKEIKKVQNATFQKYFSKLKPSLSKEHFEQCLKLSTDKLALLLKKECLSFKLTRIKEILKVLETK